MTLPESAIETYELIFGHLSAVPTEMQELFMARLLLLCAANLPRETLDDLIKKAAQFPSELNYDI